MTFDRNGARIFPRPVCTDPRKAVNGPAGIIEERMDGEPFGGSAYLFRSKDRKLLKAVRRGGNGFRLSRKRLEKDRFPWPQTNEEARELSGEELSMLLNGIDFFSAHKTPYYKKVS